MTTKSKLMMLTAAAVMSGTMGFAQEAPAPTPTPDPAPVTTPAPFSFDFLSELFGGDTAPDEAAILAAFEGENLTVERFRLRGDGSVRVEATTETGERVRVIVRDGEVRYRIKDASDSNGDNSDDTSDSNGDNSDDTSDGNGDDSSDDNSGGNGGSTGGGSSDD